MNNNLSFPMKLYRALYDVGFYVEALKEKTGKAIRFAILLGLFFGSLSMIPSVVEINRTIDSIILDMENRLPAFTIQEGVLVSSSDAPYALNMAGLAVVVDPRASETGLQADADFGFYFTKDRMSIRNAISKTAPIKYANLVRDAFGKEELVALIATMKLGGWLLIPLGGIYGIVMIFISAGLTTFFGRVVYAFSRKVISYRDSFVVAVYAQVITATLFLISAVFMMALPLFYPLCLMLMGMYYLRLSRWDETEHH